jgi:hypothetical protein
MPEKRRARGHIVTDVSRELKRAEKKTHSPVKAFNKVTEIRELRSGGRSKGGYDILGYK